MKHYQLFSRRSTQDKVDFRPDAAPESPFMQMRRLQVHLEQTSPQADDIEDCTIALDYLREYTYRKIFTGTTHEQFAALDASAPSRISASAVTPFIVKGSPSVSLFWVKVPVLSAQSMSIPANSSMATRLTAP